MADDVGIGSGDKAILVDLLSIEPRTLSKLPGVICAPFVITGLAETVKMSLVMFFLCWIITGQTSTPAPRPSRDPQTTSAAADLETILFAKRPDA